MPALPPHSGPTRVIPASEESRALWPLHSLAATRALEADAAAALPAHTLMRRAGLATARLCMAVAPHARRVLVFAGPGNNGGDGFEAAMHLSAMRPVTVVFHGEPNALPGDAADAFARAREAGVEIVRGDGSAGARIDGTDLVVDALLGVGLNREPAPSLAAAIDAMNAGPAPVLAVDVPSGLRADDGTLAGSSAVRARWTLSLLTLKPGLFTAAGRDHVGEVWFDALDVHPREAPAAELLTSAGLAPSWPRRLHAQHKGSFGDVVVLGGSHGMTGAAWLAARSASVAGAGRVYLAALEGEANLDPVHPELMHREAAQMLEDRAMLAASTLVCGCGGGDAIRAVMPAAISRAGRLLIDADGVNALARDPSLRRLLQQRGAAGRGTILTPHPLEAARLLGTSAQQVQAQRLASAESLAAEFRAVVVLKGSGTVVAGAGGPCAINATGNASLATAGTGDVLAGWIAGLWSQGLSILDAARLGVCAHGAAADEWEREAPGRALTAGELVARLRPLY